jgi:hypothetical protein
MRLLGAPALRRERASHVAIEDKVSEHHPPTPDRILANKG